MSYQTAEEGKVHLPNPNVTEKPRLNEQSILLWLKSRLSEQRLEHSLGAQKKAIELAYNYKLPKDILQKASLASLLHDAAKEMPIAELLSACETLDIPITELEKRSPQVLHAAVGAEVVKLEFDIDDTDVLNAIRYHTTGRGNMSLVEKLVYLADKMEGNTRNPLYIQKIQAIVDYNNIQTLDKALLFVVDSTISFLVEKQQVIHPFTIEAHNDLAEKIRNQNKLSHQSNA